MSAQDDTPNEDTIWDPLQGPLPQGQNPSPREDPEQRLLLFCQRDGAAHCTMPCCGPLPEAFANLLHMVKDAHGNGVPKQESPAKLEIYRRQCFHRSLRKKLPWARLQSDAAKNKLKEVDVQIGAETETLPAMSPASALLKWVDYGFFLNLNTQQHLPALQAKVHPDILPTERTSGGAFTEAIDFNYVHAVEATMRRNMMKTVAMLTAGQIYEADSADKSKFEAAPIIHTGKIRKDQFKLETHGELLGQMYKEAIKVDSMYSTLSKLCAAYSALWSAPGVFERYDLRTAKESDVCGSVQKFIEIHCGEHKSFNANCISLLKENMTDVNLSDYEQPRKKRQRVDDSMATRVAQIFVATMLDPHHDCKNPVPALSHLRTLNDRLAAEIGAAGTDDTDFFVAGEHANENSKQGVAASIIYKVQQLTGAFPENFLALALSQ